MKRNLDLIREILFYIEEVPSDPPYGSLSTGFLENFKSYSNSELMEHLDLAIKAGLIEGKVNFGTGPTYSCSVRRLTNSGHDYLEAVRSDNIWNKVKTKVEQVGGMTIATTWRIAEAMVKKELGL